MSRQQKVEWVKEQIEKMSGGQWSAESDNAEGLGLDKKFDVWKGKLGEGLAVDEDGNLWKGPARELEAGDTSGSTKLNRKWSMQSNQDLQLPILRNIAEAHAAISRIGEGWQREAIQLMIIGVQRFYSEQPSLLAGDLDTAFLVEVLKDTIALVQHCLTHEWVGWPDWEYPKGRAVVNPTDDQSRWGIRGKQSDNLIAAFAYDRGIEGALRSISSHISSKQIRTEGRNWDGTTYVQFLPCARPDYLFIVMAVHYTLRPGQPARQLLERLGDLPRPNDPSSSDLSD